MCVVFLFVHSRVAVEWKQPVVSPVSTMLSVALKGGDMGERGALTVWAILVTAPVTGRCMDTTVSLVVC